jgi:hypothetical protein
MVAEDKFVKNGPARYGFIALAIASIVCIPIMCYWLVTDPDTSLGSTLAGGATVLVQVYATLLSAVLGIYQGFPAWSKPLFSKKLQEDLEKTFSEKSKTRKVQQMNYKRVILGSVISGAALAFGGVVGCLLGYCLGHAVGIILWPAEKS